MKKTYIARLTTKTLNPSVKKYLDENAIQIVKYHASLKILVLESTQDLLKKEWKYLADIEEDRTFTTQGFKL